MFVGGLVGEEVLLGGLEGVHELCAEGVVVLEVEVLDELLALVDGELAEEDGEHLLDGEGLAVDEGGVLVEGVVVPRVGEGEGGYFCFLRGQSMTTSHW